MNKEDLELLLGIAEILECQTVYNGEDYCLYNGLNTVINEERWITIHPHGEDSEDYRRLKLKDGETPKEAIERQWGVDVEKKGKNKTSQKSNYREYSQKEKELYDRLSKIYEKGDKGDREKYNAEIRKVAEERRLNYEKLNEAVKQEIERLKNIDVNKLNPQEIEEYGKDLEDIYGESLSALDQLYIIKKRREFSDIKRRLEANSKAKEIGGYTEKLQNLTNFTVFSDISSYPSDLQKHIYESYKSVYNKYPQIKYGGLQISKLKERTYANNASYNNIVTLNETKYNDLPSLEKSYENTVQIQLHPQGTTYKSIITHELGHGLLSYITKTYKIKGSEIRAAVLKKVGIKQKDLKEHLSEYAMAKPREAHEFFAEAFAEYMDSPNPRPVAKAFGEEINRILSQKV